MRERRILVVGLILVATCFGGYIVWKAYFGSASDNDEASLIENAVDKRQRNKLLWDANLQPGLTREDVLRRVGRPDNTDCRFVFMWSTDIKQCRGRMTWREIWRNGFCETFLLFNTGGQLISHIAKDDTPEDLYYSLTGERIPVEPQTSLPASAAREPRADTECCNYE